VVINGIKVFEVINNDSKKANSSSCDCGAFPQKRDKFLPGPTKECA